MLQIVTRRSFFLLALVFACSTQVRAQVLVNEYSCSNLNTITDAFGDYRDWVELYNPGGTAVTLSGMYLSDDPANLMKWAIPTGSTIAAGGKRMVYCSGRGLLSGTQIHTSFKLTQTSGEWFILSSSTGTVVDSVHLRLTMNDHSRGRTTDGAATWGLFTTPTPNAANSAAKIDYMPKVTFDLAAGFYPGPQSVNLSCTDPTAEIRYTTNGMAPTTASTLFTTGTPISISATTLIRAAAFPTGAANYAPSFRESNTYFINETISPGFNVVSVGGDYNNFFYVAMNDIYGSMEMYDKSLNFQFELEQRSSPHGNDSWWGCDQKGFRVYSEDETGTLDVMNYQFFTNTPRDKYKCLILKAGASDNYPGYHPTSACHMRDIFVHTLNGDWNLDMDYRRYDPTIVYVNGQYWGVYEIRDHVDNDYTNYYYNQPKGQVDILKYWGGMTLEDGSDTGYVNLYNFIISNPMSVTANYDHVKQFLDVKSFVQYFILNTWMVDSDMLNWNTMWWRGRNSPGVKWKFALWDEDNIMDLGENYTGLGTTGPDNDPCNLTYLFLGNPSIMHTDMLVNLLTNPEFETLYKDQWLELLTGPLSCDHALPHFDSLVAQISPEMTRQCATWGGSFAQWQGNITTMRNNIIERCTILSQKLDSCMDFNPQDLKVNVYPAGVGMVKLDGNPILPYVWEKVMYGDTTYTLEAVPTLPYWIFDHWEKDTVVNSFTADSLTNPVTYNFNYKDSVTAVFKYFNPDSVKVTFNVSPSPAFGTVDLQGTPLPTYPYTVMLDRRFAYNLLATPAGVMGTGATPIFVRWDRNHVDSTVFTPDTLNTAVSFTYRMEDTIIAYFDSIPAPPPPPPIPPAPVAPPITTAPGLPDVNLSIPTAFSPNGDGRNDFFYIVYGKDVADVKIRVFNRWGQEVWTAGAKGDKWDGSFKTQPCEIGTYYYRIDVTYNNDNYQKKQTFNGEINLIR